jgi:Arc/MetJ-type ribon-helix-helix transcriptional regulator
MAITLSADLQAKVDDLLATGDYDSPECVIDASLNLLRRRDEQIRWLRDALREGEEDELRGDTVAWTPDLMDRLMAEADERSRLGLPIDDAVKPPS